MPNTLLQLSYEYVEIIPYIRSIIFFKEELFN